MASESSSSRRNFFLVSKSLLHLDPESAEGSITPPQLAAPKRLVTCALEGCYEYIRVAQDLLGCDSKEKFSFCIGDADLIPNSWKPEDQAAPLIQLRVGEHIASKSFAAFSHANPLKIKTLSQPFDFKFEIIDRIGEALRAIRNDENSKDRKSSASSDSLPSSVPISVSGDASGYILLPPSAALTHSLIKDLKTAAAKHLASNNRRQAAFDLQSITLHCVTIINDNIDDGSLGEEWRRQPGWYSTPFADPAASASDVKITITYLLASKCVEFFTREAAAALHMMSITVAGIPMREAVTAATAGGETKRASFDVPLLCSAESMSNLGISPHDLFKLQWRRTEPKNSIDFGHLLLKSKAVAMVPATPYAAPTQCLVKHVGSGKPVSVTFVPLSLSGDAAAPAAPQRLFLLMQHGSTLFLHDIHELPRFTLPDFNSISTSQSTHQIAERSALNIRRRDFSAIMLSSVVSHPPVSKQQQQSSSSSSSSSVKSKWTRTSLVQLPGTNTQYCVPEYIERCTRFFPSPSFDIQAALSPHLPQHQQPQQQADLLADAARLFPPPPPSFFSSSSESGSVHHQSLLNSQSLLFDYTNRIGPTYYAKIRTVLFTIYKPELSDEDVTTCQQAFSNLYHSNTGGKDSGWFPDSSLAERWDKYRRLWAELRFVVKHFSTTSDQHAKVFKELEKLWPTFAVDQAASVSGSGASASGASGVSSSGAAASATAEEDEEALMRDIASINRKNKRIVEVKRLPDGTPELPITFGALTVHCLGTVVTDRPAYHSEKYVWPVGFRSIKIYGSMIDKNKKVNFTSEIRDHGEAPLFVVTPEDDPEHPVTGKNATSVWSHIVDKVAELRGKQRKNPEGKKFIPSGPEYFGLGNPTIYQLSLELPGVEKIWTPNYIAQLCSNTLSAAKQTTARVKDPEASVTGVALDALTALNFASPAIQLEALKAKKSSAEMNDDDHGKDDDDDEKMHHASPFSEGPASSSSSSGYPYNQPYSSASTSSSSRYSYQSQQSSNNISKKPRLTSAADLESSGFSSKALSEVVSSAKVFDVRWKLDLNPLVEAAHSKVEQTLPLVMDDGAHNMVVDSGSIYAAAKKEEAQESDALQVMDSGAVVMSSGKIEPVEAENQKKELKVGPLVRPSLAGNGAGCSLLDLWSTSYKRSRTEFDMDGRKDGADPLYSWLSNNRHGSREAPPPFINPSSAFVNVPPPTPPPYIPLPPSLSYTSLPPPPAPYLPSPTAQTQPYQPPSSFSIPPSVRSASPANPSIE